MNSIAPIVGGFLQAVVYTILFSGAYKIFMISNELREIKDLLKEIKRTNLVPQDLYPGTALPQPLGEWTVLDEK